MFMVTLETTFRELETLPELEGMGKYIMYCDHDFLEEYHMKEMKLAEVGAIGWSPKATCRGINLFIEKMTSKKVKVYFVYSEGESQDDAQKQNVNLIHMKPEQIDSEKPFIILISGGAYANVSNGTEAFPTADHFLKQGYQVFIFTYRVGGTRAVPRAMDDLATAVRYIGVHAEKLKVNPENYIMVGYSAGANISATWGCKNVGYAAYNLPKPKALFQIYTLVDLEALRKQYECEEARENMDEGVADWDGTTIMLGENYSEEELHKYNVIEQVDSDYPNCFITCGKNDVLVSPDNSVTLKKKLDENEVFSVLELKENAQHGFGDGTGTDAEGWPERALKFVEKVCGK